MSDRTPMSRTLLILLRLCFVALTIWGVMQVVEASSKASVAYALLHAIPLMIALPGVWRDRTYTLQWSSMLLLLYMMEGIIHVMSPWAPNQRADGALELAASAGAFVLMLLMVGPRKRAAKARDRT